MQSFRGIGNLTLDFHEAEPTVLVGINGVGKSSIIDCLAILLSRFTSSIQHSTSSGRFFSEKDITNGRKETHNEIIVSFNSAEATWSLTKVRRGRSKDSSSHLSAITKVAENIRKELHTSPNLALEYTNLIASCQGESEEPPTVPVHCGHKKKYWYDENLMVSPLEINCADFFKYPASGEIQPTDNPGKKPVAETIIKKLALDIDKLQKMRKVAIDAALLATEGLTEIEIQLLAEGYEKLDVDGKHTPFCAAISYLLKNYF